MKLEERFRQELQKTNVANLPQLLQYMEREHGFYWVRSSGHDHWTNGTAQHSWRVYQYMRYMWQHSTDEKVRALTETEIILTGLLHDVGKMKGCDHHATHSKEILEKQLGPEFAEHYPQVLASIWFHHHANNKRDERLDIYKQSALKFLLNRADCMASGTTWNSTRFKKGEPQNWEESPDMKSLCAVAQDRTIQVLNYGMYLDKFYDFHTIRPYDPDQIVWNGVPADKDTDILIVSSDELSDLKIRSNVVKALFYCHSKEYDRHSYDCDSVLQSLNDQWKRSLSDKGVYLPGVCFFRASREDGYPMIVPYYKDVLIVKSSSAIKFFLSLLRSPFV